jgi:cytochrome subunit of sulfide dehydrogenase
MTKKIFIPILLVYSAALCVSLAGAAQADIGALTKSCAGCHGADGSGANAEVPIIGGMSSVYIADTLGQYKSGDRKNCEEVKSDSGEMSDMCKAAKDLSGEDIQALADHYAGKKFTRAKQSVDAALVKKGREIAEQACEKCHTDGGSIAADDAGILLGQRKAYLKRELADFRSGKREAPKKMAPKIEKLDQAEIDALVEYYAGGQK